MSDTTRFRVMYRFAPQGATPIPGAITPYVVLDLEPPDAPLGEVTVFGSFESREAAVMTCMALNGAKATP